MMRFPKLLAFAKVDEEAMVEEGNRESWAIAGY